jgi:predicted PurR-regulated permease PerM
MDTHWKPATKYIAAIVLALITLAALRLAGSFFAVIILGGILAFLLLPIVRFFEQRLRFPRGLATITTYILLLVVLALVPVLLVPVAIDAVRDINVDAFVNWLQQRASIAEEFLRGIRTLHFLQFEISLNSLVDPALEILAGTTPEELPTIEAVLGYISTALGPLTTAAGVVATFISSLAFYTIVTLVVSIYLSIDAPRFHHAAIDMVPENHREEFETLLDKVLRVWSAYFRGQITVILILSLVSWLGGTAIGLPGAFLLGITTGILNIIPNLGPILAFVPAGIVALVQGSTYLPVSNFTFLLIVAGLFVLIQQFEGHLITPRIVGGAIDLPPIMVLLGVLIGASAFGLLGAILASPTVATFKVIAIYTWNKILDRDPFRNLEPEPRPAAIPTPLVKTALTTYEQLHERYHQLITELHGPSDEEE